jgi:hypothetical protein
MEIQRLKPMKPGYDEELFNDLYQKTKALRSSLVYHIDARRLGVTKDEISSWFDDKFIYVFNKYYGEKEPDVLLGYLINSLKQFRNRVLRKAYQESIYENVIRWDEVDLINIIPDEKEDKDRDVLVKLMDEFFRKRLSMEAYQVLSIQLNPPLYIISKIKSSTSHIPAWLIAEFLGWPDTKYSLKLVNKFRKEIESTTLEAKAYFSNVTI